MSEPDTTSIELPTRQGYDRWSDIYDEEDNPLITLEDVHVRNLLDEVFDLSVLDTGCGTGRHALALAQRGANVTAIDFSPGMLAKARAKPGADSICFLQHDVEDALPFSTAQFDRVVCSLVVDHVKNLLGLFREMGRVCKPDGFVVVTTIHPAMLLKGVQARFTDPETGLVTRPASQRHQICDYVLAALAADLSIEQMKEYAVDASLASRSVRARRYLDWPMLLLFKLRPPRG